MLTEQQINGLTRGDMQAFRALYEHFFVALCIFARGLGQDRQQAEDVVQDVFYRLFNDHRLFENVASLKSYLYGAVRNGCLNNLRDEKRRRQRDNNYFEQLGDEGWGSNLAVEVEVDRQLLTLLRELPPQCRLIFEHTLAGLTSEQIAQLMNLSIETVKTQRKKAKRILKERYALLYKSLTILFL